MSDSQSQDIDQEEIIYEEEEVDQVHGAKQQSDGEVEYTVFFFGDNTHSRLGGSKLRRFLDSYTDFYPKAKTNRKLQLSIQRAEQKLLQNGTSPSIFENLRNSMKKNKKPRKNLKTQSKIQSQDIVNNLEEEPQLMRNNSFPNHNEKVNKDVCSLKKIIPEEQKQCCKKGKKKKNIDKQQKIAQEKDQIEFNSESLEQQSQQQDSPQILNYRTRSEKPKLLASKIELKSQKEKFSSSENEESEQKTYPLRTAQKTKLITRGVPKKRGRPKKIIQDPQQQQSEESVEVASENSQNNKVSPKNVQHSLIEGRKTRFERNLQQKLVTQTRQITDQKIIPAEAQKYPISSQTKQLILQRVKFCLDKRQELIQYLDELKITASIIQEILDLDVTTVILDGGPATLQSIRVLQKLKSILLHKYFPDDIKIKKKYQKITKKTQSLRTSMTENEESLEDLGMRRKTLIKLEKILKNLDQTEDQKQKAVVMESYFRKYDESIGNRYKSVAYKVLRSLKDKAETFDEVIEKLESGYFDQSIK